MTTKQFTEWNILNGTAKFNNTFDTPNFRYLMNSLGQDCMVHYRWHQLPEQSTWSAEWCTPSDTPPAKRRNGFRAQSFRWPEVFCLSCSVPSRRQPEPGVVGEDVVQNFGQERNKCFNKFSLFWEGEVWGNKSQRGAGNLLLFGPVFKFRLVCFAVVKVMNVSHARAHIELKICTQDCFTNHFRANEKHVYI